MKRATKWMNKVITLKWFYLVQVNENALKHMEVCERFTSLRRNLVVSCFELNISACKQVNSEYRMICTSSEMSCLIRREISWRRIVYVLENNTGFVTWAFWGLHASFLYTAKETLSSGYHKKFSVDKGSNRTHFKPIPFEGHLSTLDLPQCTCEGYSYQLNSKLLLLYLMCWRKSKKCLSCIRKEKGRHIYTVDYNNFLNTFTFQMCHSKLIDLTTFSLNLSAEKIIWLIVYSESLVDVFVNEWIVKRALKIIIL